MLVAVPTVVLTLTTIPSTKGRRTGRAEGPHRQEVFIPASFAQPKLG